MQKDRTVNLSRRCKRSKILEYSFRDFKIF